MPTPIQPPSVLASVEIAALGKATRNGRFHYPSVTVSQKLLMVVCSTSKRPATALPPYQGKKLSDFYTSQGAVLVDAFLAANLAGGT